MTLAEKGILSAEVVLTGFVVVFAVLILLIVLISIYGAIVSGAEKSAKKKQERKKAESLQPVVTTSVKTATPVNQTNGISDEIVAVISAAVYSMYGSKEKVKITSIKKSNGGRSSWANAGVLNNTRPF